jgi:DNA end-binding protein Ku
LEARDKGIIAWSLRSHDEVRDAADYFDDIPVSKPNAQMIDIATKIIEQQEGPFDPKTFTDRYEDALRKLIKSKEKGAKNTVRAEEPEDTNVVDLMDVLRRSLGRSGGSKAPANAAQAHKAPPKKRAATKKRA